MREFQLKLLVLLGLIVSAPVSALDIDVKGLTVDGRLKAGYSVLYDLEQGSDDGPQNYLSEIKATYRPNRNLTLIGNLWVRGQANDPDFVERTGGLKNLFAGPPFPSGSFQHGASNCNLQAREFCAPNDELDIFDDFDDEVIRELSLKYKDSKRRYTFKVGKFQRGWGQSDGLRLLDILHAQDLRERFVFKDTDEIRIPAWMISADFNFSKMGIAAPFEAIGMKRPVLEVNIIPEVRHSEVLVNNPTTSDATDGGTFGLPWPDFSDIGLPHQSGLGAVAFGAKLDVIEMDDFDEPEVGVRLKFESLGGTMTLNAFYGRQDLPIVKMRGATVHVGSGVNDPAGSVANVEVDHATLLAALWLPDFANPTATSPTAGNPSGYLPYLRGAAGKSPLTTSPLTLLTGGGCNDPVNDPGGTGLECSVSVHIDLDFTYRQKLVGASFTRDMGDFVSFGPKGTSPSMRIELSHEFDKPFNQSVVQNPFFAAQSEKGAVANFVSPSASIVERDVTSLMMGFDYPLWVPGWAGQQKSIFTSFQWFNLHTEDADNLMAQAPYGTTEVETNQNYVTFLWSAPLDNQRLVLEGLFIRNIDGHGTSYRQRIDFNYFGGHWRPRLEIQHFSGRAEVAPIGIFDDKDFIELSITYQF
ncbi:MAG: DUF1302 family protein [bacterium]|nr:hypothetical protein [Gammaproteobacteria bacterium]HIL84785.1 hypothetical protein [Pseudomonadales bacterium]